MEARDLDVEGDHREEAHTAHTAYTRAREFAGGLLRYGLQRYWAAGYSQASHVVRAGSFPA